MAGRLGNSTLEASQTIPPATDYTCPQAQSLAASSGHGAWAPICGLSGNCRLHVAPPGGVCVRKVSPAARYPQAHRSWARLPAQTWIGRHSLLQKLCLETKAPSEPKNLLMGSAGRGGGQGCPYVQQGNLASWLSGMSTPDSPSHTAHAQSHMSPLARFPTAHSLRACSL